MTAPDVPTEVYAALRAAVDLAPTGQAAPAERATWWEQHAVSDEAAQRAYERLAEWSIATEQPGAVTLAIGEAVDRRRESARQCRREADQARRDAR